MTGADRFAALVHHQSLHSTRRHHQQPVKPVLPGDFGIVLLEGASERFSVTIEDGMLQAFPYIAVSDSGRTKSKATKEGSAHMIFRLLWVPRDTDDTRGGRDEGTHLAILTPLR